MKSHPSLVCFALFTTLCCRSAPGAVEVVSQSSQGFAEVQLDLVHIRTEGPTLQFVTASTPDRYVHASMGPVQFEQFRLPPPKSGGVFVGQGDFVLQSYNYVLPPIPHDPVVARIGIDAKLDFNVTDVSIQMQTIRTSSKFELINLSTQSILMTQATPFDRKTEVPVGEYQLHLHDTAELVGFHNYSDRFNEILLEVQYAPTPEPASVLIWLAVGSACYAWTRAT